ncbi:MAG TPA: hypothetical protein VLL97_11755 [Acidobacteriota bacterium]|nr:hypothetical protein [Acidobacteriota bacterium]
MNISSSVSHMRIDLATAKALPQPPLAGKMTDDQKARLEEFMKGAEPDPAARARGLEQQSKIQAHTIFTVGGKVVATQWANGWSSFQPGGQAASDMSNIDGADNRAAFIEKTLRQVYGAQLEVHDFSNSPSAPTMGDLEPVMQNRKTLQDVLSARSGGSGGPNPLLSLTGSALSLLHDRSR